MQPKLLTCQLITCRRSLTQPGGMTQNEEQQAEYVPRMQIKQTSGIRRPRARARPASHR